MTPLDFLLTPIGIGFLLGGVSAVLVMIKMWGEM